MPQVTAAADATGAGGGCFEDWRKDALFDAAEAVQESADRMESAYGAWIRGCGREEEHEDLLRDIRAALRTAKWQLQQFERAVELNLDKFSSEEGTIARRRQFVDAIQNQINSVELSMNDSLVNNGQYNRNWAHLDDDERDDLVAFLSAAPQPLKVDAQAGNGRKNSSSSDRSKGVTPESSEESAAGCSRDGYDCRIIIDVEKDEGAKPDQRKQGIPACKFLALDDLLVKVKYMAKVKWLGNGIAKAKEEDGDLEPGDKLPDYAINQASSLSTQRFVGAAERSKPCWVSPLSKSQFYRRIQGVQHGVHSGQSARIALVLVVSVILIVPFFLHAT